MSKDEICGLSHFMRRSQRTIFSWAMGVTHHQHGSDTVRLFANLAMMRGMLGRPGTGLLPLRGHSNVQGMGTMGVTPQLKQTIFNNLEQELNVTLPTNTGLDTLACMEKAHNGDIDFAWCLGGNLYDSNPDAAYAAEALQQIGVWSLI
jgi:predicted molibdopterin-dependent oxidoreductase YjgC